VKSRERPAQAGEDFADLWAQYSSVAYYYATLPCQVQDPGDPRIRLLASRLWIIKDGTELQRLGYGLLAGVRIAWAKGIIPLVAGPLAILY
jgi:hypothetical protein